LAAQPDGNCGAVICAPPGRLYKLAKVPKHVSLHNHGLAQGTVRKPPLRSQVPARKAIHAGNTLYALGVRLLECAIACRKRITCASQQVSV
jgi:hypothetical protein